MATNIRDLQVRDDVIVTIAGTVVAVREDEFLLQDSTGQIWVDAERQGAINLAIGEQVTVIGDLDDLEDFDAAQIIRSDGSSGGQPPTGGAIGRPNRPDPTTPVDPRVGNAPKVNIGDLRVQDDLLVTITGTVTRVRGNEFVLRDRTGRVLVDKSSSRNRRLDIAVGDRLTVVGDLDDGDFDALRIKRVRRAGLAQPRSSGQAGERDLTGGRNRSNDLSPWVNQSTGTRNFAGLTNGLADTVTASGFAVDSSIF